VKTENIRAPGRVTQCLANYKFAILLDGGHRCIAHLCGKMVKNYIRVTTGDECIVALSPYDLSRGVLIERVTR